MKSVVIFLALFLILFIVSMSYYNTKNTMSVEGFGVKESSIQGVGIFADKNYGVDEQLFKAIENDKSTVTEYGSKINHCSKPHIVNTYLKEMENGEWTLFSKKNILAGEELTCDYNNTPDFIVKPDKNWTC